MSLMTSARSFSSTMAAPPYLMTTVLPVMFLIHGSASNSTWPVRSSVSFARLLVSIAYFMRPSLRELGSWRPRRRPGRGAPYVR